MTRALWSEESYKMKNKNLFDGRAYIRFRDNQARTDDFHHVKVTLYR
uniref:ORF46h n=1 Tax=Pinus koraiensis TaxID=88728 RepID=A4QMF0_PINKO|nr:ORF46h [Pinus koraiensis]ABP35487.1 ORF46h [Pinus koraiensis]